MINAYGLTLLTDLEKTILARYIKGYNYARVTYLFEKHTLSEIDFIKQMLLDHGYSIDEVNLYADTKQVGITLDIFW